jgi:hypothetical protein
MTIPVFRAKHIWQAWLLGVDAMGLPELHPMLAKFCLSSEYDACRTRNPGGKHGRTA